jgi:hypothetical protein
VSRVRRLVRVETRSCNWSLDKTGSGLNSRSDGADDIVGTQGRNNDGTPPSARRCPAFVRFAILSCKPQSCCRGKVLDQKSWLNQKTAACTKINRLWGYPPGQTYATMDCNNPEGTTAHPSPRARWPPLDLRRGRLAQSLPNPIGSACIPRVSTKKRASNLPLWYLEWSVCGDDPTIDG